MEQEKEIVYACSRCGSFNVGKPFNSAAIELKCFECGHARHFSHKRWMELAMTGSVDILRAKREF